MADPGAVDPEAVERGFAVQSSDADVFVFDRILPREKTLHHLHRRFCHRSHFCHWSVYRHLTNCNHKHCHFWSLDLTFY